ncbi:ribonuclease M5 [Ureaplasma ceti]|uniref:Ribonuclease M5 n=1 Tax=Ureaplasma ceti TaxID=3119530 RepID=A0ABP9U755_9BACT
MKPKIQETIIVEGKTDTIKLKSIFDVETIETNGSEINKKTLQLIKLASEKNGVILFLDPDGPGERIRKIISQELPYTKQCFVKKSDIVKGSKKIGIAEATPESIIKALNNYVVFEQKSISSISLTEYNELNITTKAQRQLICDHLKISYCNNKQLLRRLNLIGITKEQVLAILGD